MIVPIADLLDAGALQRVRTLLGTARFEDGRRTAGWHARAVKENEQAVARDPLTAEASAIVADALLLHPVFRAAALPRRLRPVLFARYAGSGAYGAHTDDPLMGMYEAAGPTRVDVSVTVFLAPPESYGGGELVIESAAGETAYKLPAGSALVYPATTLHFVAPVIEGERLVAVTWAQSVVRDPAAREILFDLDIARRAVHAEAGDTDTFRRLTKTHANLLRRWAEV